ncbi:MAG: hypothetical protein JWN08_1155, partial [Frankiales bacterium]|nr:hypothetical protein [Frankiales bacterium]
GAAALVLQAGESGYALHSDGPTLRRALGRRLAAPGSYRAVVEADTRPTSYVWAGQALRFPVASTRSDLDLVARAGARLWQVLGLTRADVVVSALPTEPTALVQGLSLAALGAGSPLLAPGPDGAAEALRLVPATVLVVPAARAVEVVQDLDDLGAPLASVTTVLVAGAPSDGERAALVEALRAVGVTATVLAVHVPDGHRLVWGECRPSGGSSGLHTYPDLEVVELVDAETGESAGAGASEVVVTQLGLFGSALLRWRTGDVAEAVTTDACPSCRRNVPRVVGVRRGALVPELALRTGTRSVDLRAVASALSGRPDVADWRIVLGRSGRDGADELLVHLSPPAGTDAAAVAVAVAKDVRLAAGLLPTQVVVADDGALPLGSGVTRRILD